MARRAPSNQHGWEAQGFHLSCLLILRIPAKHSLLGRAVFACRRRECKTKRFINSAAPLTASGPSPSALRSSYEGKGLHSTEPAPSSVDQEPFPICTRLCVGRIGSMRAHIPMCLQACSHSSCQGPQSLGSLPNLQTPLLTLPGLPLRILPIDGLSPPLNWQIFLGVPHRPGT